MNSIAENFDDDNMHPDQFRTRENGIQLPAEITEKYSELYGGH